nr:MAG TPA: hypothetical protein [Caudoviricetes sp.]
MGSSFSNLLTSFNDCSTPYSFLSTPDSAFSSLEVSPPISIVIPFILLPALTSLLYSASISACVAIFG